MLLLLLVKQKRSFVRSFVRLPALRQRRALQSTDRRPTHTDARNSLTFAQNSLPLLLPLLLLSCHFDICALNAREQASSCERRMRHPLFASLFLFLSRYSHTLLCSSFSCSLARFHSACAANAKVSFFSLSFLSNLLLLVCLSMSVSVLLLLSLFSSCCCCLFLHLVVVVVVYVVVVGGGGCRLCLSRKQRALCWSSKRLK